MSSRKPIIGANRHINGSRTPSSIISNCTRSRENRWIIMIFKLSLAIQFNFSVRRTVKHVVVNKREPNNNSNEGKQPCVAGPVAFSTSHGNLQVKNTIVHYVRRQVLKIGILTVYFICVVNYERSDFVHGSFVDAKARGGDVDVGAGWLQGGIC